MRVPPRPGTTVRGSTLMQQPLEELYAPVWQTWTLLRHRPTTSATAATTAGAAVVAPTQTTLRERMQIARIQNRLTVHELAQRTGCDVETLASFERGEGVVSDDVQRRICAELRLA